MRHLVIAALAAVAATATPLNAQTTMTAESGPKARFYVLGGGFSPVKQLGRSTAPAEFRSGPAFSAGVSYELHPLLAVRLEGTYARTEADGAGWPTAVRDRKFTRLAGAGDLQLKVPTSSGVTPYLFAGAGLMSFNPAGAASVSGATFSRFAARAGLGLEYHPGTSPVGVMVQGTSWFTKYNRNGFNRSQVDLAWQAGVSLRF